MCVYSMIADHFHDKWTTPPYKWPFDQPPQQPQPIVPVPYPMPLPIPMSRPITQEEVDELRRLLEKAKKYDEETGQKDCEIEEKKDKLRKLADEFGIPIVFP